MPNDDISFDDAPPANSATAAEDFFSSGAASCRFNNIGDAHQGTIIAMEEAQQRDIQTKALAHWPDGNPKMMLVVTLQTSEHDDQIDDDDGKRRLYVNKPSGMFAAIRDAVGKEKFRVGGKLAVKYVKNGKPKQPGFSAPKEYAAKYVPSGVPHDLPASGGEKWTWQQAVANAAIVGLDAGKLKALLNNDGITTASDPLFTAHAKTIIAEAKSAAGGDINLGEEPPF